jgi:hypothetical protein
METLKKGSTGSSVIWLQQRLIDLGYKNCFIDGKLKVLSADGDFGPITEECLESFQAKIIDDITQDFINKNVPSEYHNEFVVNGEMNFAVHFVLENFEKLRDWYKVEINKPEYKEEIIKEKPEEPYQQSIKDLVIEIAKQEIGIIEQGGNNMGERVEEYQNVGSNGEISEGAPWCQYFMNWLEIEAAKRLSLEYKGLYNGYTPSIVNWGVKNNIGIKNCKMNDIEIGDWGFVYSPARKNAKHVFLIIGKNEKNNSVITIEGNTNPGGGSDGFGVFKRTRPLGTQCWAIVKWWKLYK